MTREISIWGDKWASVRKWVYPAWLAYEATQRFSYYALNVHNFLDINKE